MVVWPKRPTILDVASPEFEPLLLLFRVLFFNSFPKLQGCTAAGCWARRAGEWLLEWLDGLFVPDGPVVLGIDDTTECRGGGENQGSWNLS